MTTPNPLRLQAESRLATQTPAATERMLHELQVHQIELEMQNDELRRMQVELSLSQERYVDLYDLAPVGYVTLSEAGVIVKANLTAALLLGVARGVLGGQLLSRYILRDDRDGYSVCCQQLQQTGEAQACDRRMVKVDGTVFWAHLAAVMTSAADGAPLMRIVMSDISERKAAELALLESEQRFRKLLQNIPSVAVQGYAMDGITTYWNQASEVLYGYTATEALGRNLLDLIIPEAMKSGVREALAGMVASGQVFPESELTLRHKDGSPVEVFSSHTLVEIQGRASELFCLDIDISERKRAVVALRESLHEKESLLQELHHRVKNNLQIISSLLRLQAGQLDSPGGRAALQDMQNRVRSLALIHEHLYQSQNLAAVDLADYLQNLCQQLFRAEAATPGAVQLHLELDPLHLEIDQAIPCGLLVNELVSNALKHAFPEARRGEVRVELRALVDGAGWRLRVADDGVGLPPDFDLQQLTSLGLKLVTVLTHQIGGQLEIGAGPGAVFEVVCLEKPPLPLPADRLDANEPPGHPPF